jgi:hypothetical protein
MRTAGILILILDSFAFTFHVHSGQNFYDFIMIFFSPFSSFFIYQTLNTVFHPTSALPLPPWRSEEKNFPSFCLFLSSRELTADENSAQSRKKIFFFLLLPSSQFSRLDYSN